MASPENITMVKNLIEELLEKMTFEDFSIEIKGEPGGSGENTVFNVKIRQSSLLIGQHGVTLRALQHLVRVMARKKTLEKLRVLVDVNDYSQQKISSLEDLAVSLANQAISEKRPMVLRPMSAYERRIVHMKLSSDSRIKTESIGEGEERKIVISPIGNLEGM